MVYLLKMVIFHSYVSLPEGIFDHGTAVIHNYLVLKTPGLGTGENPMKISNFGWQDWEVHPYW
jgi:hypothetical protein